jgi:hypothetical protein
MRGVLLDPPTRLHVEHPRELIRSRAQADDRWRAVADNLDRASAVAGPFEPRGSGNTWQELIRTEIADATAVANTATETLLVPAFTMPVRYLMTPGLRALRLQIRGRYGTTATPTILFRLRIGTATGGVAIAASAAYTTPTTVTTVPFVLNYVVQVRSGGATGTAFGMGDFTLSTAAPNTLATQHIPATAPAVSAAIDMTAQQDISPTVTWGTANAANTIQAHLYTLEALN